MDTIAELLTRIRNAMMADKTSVQIPYSKTRERIAKILSRLGYLDNVQVDGKSAKRTLVFDIQKDENGVPKIKGLERYSKLSRRLYLGYRDIKPVKNGHGNVILSTPAGIMTGDEAKKEKVGGEALFKVW